MVRTIFTSGGATKVRTVKNDVNTRTIMPNFVNRSMSVIFTALADRTLKMTDILETIKVNK